MVARRPTTADGPESAREPVCGPSYDDRTTFIEQLHQSIESRLQELTAEISKFEDAKRALSNGSAKPAPEVESNDSRSKPQRKPKRSIQVLQVGQLERILGESAEGLSTAVRASQRGLIRARGGPEPVANFNPTALRRRYGCRI